MNMKDLNDLKREYESIPIPPGLDFRVRASIRQSRIAQKKRETAKKRRYLKNFFGSCAAAMLTVVVLANSTASVAHAMEQVPFLGAITRVFTFRTFEDAGENTVARVDVPEVENGGALNDEIKRYTDEIIAEYQHDAGIAAESLNDPAAGETNHYALDLTYETVTDNDALFALRFNKTVVMAGGTESVKIYNIDKATGELLTLGSLFQDRDAGFAAVSQSIKEQMARRMEADSSVYYWLDDEVEAWNFQSVTDDTAFYVNGEGLLTIVFNEGDVAPMYMGVVEFTIPADALQGAAQSDYLD